MNPPDEPPLKRVLSSSSWPWIVLGAALLFGAFVHLRLLDIPLERDEGEYAYAGQLILEGVPPYALVYNMKLPGVYAAYALIEALFGQTAGGIHAGFLFVNAAGVVLVFLLGRRLFGPAVGAASAASYAVLSVGAGVYGTSAHATHFVVVPALAGFLLLLHGEKAGRIGISLASGLLFGAAFVMKQHGVFFLLFVWLVFAVPRLRKRPLAARKTAAEIALFTLALAAPFVLTCIALYLAGVWDHFWFWTFRYAREYVSIVPLGQGLENLGAELPNVVEAPIWIWVLAVIGLFALTFETTLRERRELVLSFTVFSFLTVVPGLYFRGHYFVTALPAVALLAGAGFTSIRGQLARNGRRGGWAIGLFALALGWAVAQQRTFFFEASPLEASRALYGIEPFPEAVEIARHLAAETEPRDRILVWGAEPEIYFYSHRRSATGYIYVFGIWEENRYSPGMAREMMKEVEAAAPKYIVIEFVPKGLVPAAERFLNDSYVLDGRVDMIAPLKTNYSWGDQLDRRDFGSRRKLFIYKRKQALPLSSSK